VALKLSLPKDQTIGTFDKRCYDKLALPFLVGSDSCPTWGFTDPYGVYLGAPFDGGVARPRYGTLSQGVCFCDGPLALADYVFTKRIGDATPYSTVPPVLRVLVIDGAPKVVWRFPQDEGRGIVHGRELWVGPDGAVVRQTGISKWERTGDTWNMPSTLPAQEMCVRHSKRLGLDPAGWDVMFDQGVPRIIEVNGVPYTLPHEAWE
jgi:hypothetical protein